MTKTLLSFGHGYSAQALTRLLPDDWRVIGTTRSEDKAVALMQANILKLPEGEYACEDYLDNDGITDLVEAGGTDANFDGLVDGFSDPFVLDTYTESSGSSTPLTMISPSTVS